MHVPQASSTFRHQNQEALLRFSLGFLRVLCRYLEKAMSELSGGLDATLQRRGGSPLPAVPMGYAKPARSFRELRCEARVMRFFSFACACSNPFVRGGGSWESALVVLIHEMYELGIDPVFWSSQPSVNCLLVYNAHC